MKNNLTAENIQIMHDLIDASRPTSVMQTIQFLRTQTCYQMRHILTILRIMKMDRRQQNQQDATLSQGGPRDAPYSIWVL